MTTHMTMTLASLSERTGIAVLDHLEKSLTVPVIDGLQAQGDLIVIPLHVVAESVRVPDDAPWQDVPPEGVELLQAEAGGNTHTLVADPGTCRWTHRTGDLLAIGVFEASAVTYLIHPEHGASGCAPGTYVVRRQREHDRDRWGGTRFVCD